MIATANDTTEDVPFRTHITRLYNGTSTPPFITAPFLSSSSSLFVSTPQGLMAGHSPFLAPRHTSYHTRCRTGSWLGRLYCYASSFRFLSCYDNRDLSFLLYASYSRVSTLSLCSNYRFCFLALSLSGSLTAADQLAVSLQLIVSSLLPHAACLYDDLTTLRPCDTTTSRHYDHVALRRRHLRHTT